MPLTEVAVNDDRGSSPARTYSTERYTRLNNGIAIPQQLRDRIEASAAKAEEDICPQTFLSRGQGFF